MFDLEVSLRHAMCHINALKFWECERHIGHNDNCELNACLHV